LLSRHPLGTSLAASPAQRGSGLVLAFVALVFLVTLPGRNLHYADGVPDHVGWPLLAFRSFGH
jgi:hypothetical protein